MKKKKGFTLIELLAAVVIITVLLVLSAPKVIDIVEKADKAAFENDVKTMIATAKLQYEVKDADDFYSEENKIDDDEYEGVKLPELPAYEFYNSKQVNEKYKLNVKGVKLPKSGGLYVVAGINRVEETHEFIEYDNDNVQIYVDNLISNNGKWCAKTNDNNPEEIEIGKTSDPSMNCNASGHAGDTSVCRVDAYKKRGRVMNYEINSLCDFYALANDYYEPVQLKQQLDTETNTSKKAEIQKKLDDAEKRLASYKQKGIKLMVDLDMSETYSETAKDGNGRSISEFAMIGNAQYPFNAKFDGGAHTIKNLNLTKSQNNVGIFGTTNSSAEIYGLILENNNISGVHHTGTLIGYDNKSKVYEIQINSGNVYGNEYVGGLIGLEESRANHHNILVKDITVNGRLYTSPIEYNCGETNSIVEKATITNPRYYNDYWNITNGDYTSYTNVTENGGLNNGFAGADLGDINFYENMGMDTWIGNDNDSSGYYWDYENDTDKNVVLKKVTTSPITFNLSGNGTKENPYVIKTWKDWKEVSSKLDTSAYYILNNDLDFTDKQFYMLGSRVNQMNSFNIDGNNKYIKNVSINARNVHYVGISGWANNSTFYGLNLDNNNINGNSHTGTLIGHDNNCTVYEVMLKSGNVYGSEYVGGLIGWENTQANHHNILVKDITVVGRGSSYVSAIVFGGETNSIVEKATITNPRYYNDYWNITNGDYTSYTNVTENGGLNNGFVADDLGDINFYENMGMDTWIGNDNDNSGYYWDYENDTDKNVILKKTTDTPITFNLSGSGTKTNPYVIKTWKDWKEVSSRLSTSAYYILNNDLDFTDKQFYMLGSRLNQMTKFNIEGKNKVLSGVLINARNVAYVGISGWSNESTFYGLNLEDNNINGNSHTGTLIGHDYNCTVHEIQINSGNVYGNEFVGGLIGWENTQANHHNILVKDITVVGRGASYVSAIVHGGETNSIVEKATITNPRYNNDYWNITNGDYTSYRNVVENEHQYDAFVVEDLADINFYENMGMDTWIGNDNDNSGYYWDYDLDHDSEYYNQIVLKDAVHNPITFNLRGNGTQSSPYLITNEQDWKEVSTKLSTSAYYRVTNNLSFTGDKKFYMLGSRVNPMNAFNMEFMNKYIRNVTINARNVAYVGISGNANNSTFYGLNLDNNNINGNSYTGTLIGHDYNCTVYEVMLKGGNVYGSEYVGGLIGYEETQANHHNILVKDITVVGRGSSYVSAIVFGGEKNSIVEKATITNPRTNNDYWNITNGDYTSYTNVTENGGLNNGFVGEDLGDINFYENMGMDTWIGSDNDNSGYYWDYENDTDKNVILKKTTDTPITFNLSGSGTKTNPYVIKTWKDWKEVSSRLSTSAYYILNNDLDFTDKQFYMLGSRLNQMNSFNMEFKNKVLSGVLINARNVAYVGISGWANNSTFYGLNLEDNNINGNSHTGTLIGHDYNCTVYELMLKNGDVYGNEFVGGLIGYEETQANHHNILVKDITVVGRGSSYVSAIVHGGETNSIVEKATITNPRYYNDYWNITNGDYTSYINVIENGGTYNGFVAADLGDINFYENMGMDTWIGSDNDNSGYYWDYENDTDKNVILKKVTDTPITFTLSGAGTKENPYVIKTWKDWKEVSSRLSTSAYYILNNDLDFSGKQFYMLGSRLNQMTEFNIEGKNKVLSGALINARNVAYVGISGWANNSTFYGLKLEDNNINGNSHTGTLIGHDYNCTVYEIQINNGNVYGNEYVGGLIGWENTQANHHNILVKDITVEGRGASYVSAIVFGGETNSVVEKATITNPRYYNDYWNITNGDYTYYARVMEGTTPDNRGNNANYDLADLGDINFYENAGMDTWIGSDNDNSGYYWDYENDNVKNVILKKTTDTPITWTLTGSGTPSDPYIINSWKTWKEATAKVGTSAIYKLTSNLDFTDKQFYMLGSRVNPLNSITLNGGNKEISGALINARQVHYVGISGWANTSTFFGLNLDNNNINGLSHTGTLIGHDYNCNVLEIMVKSGNVYGNEYVGGLIGWEESQTGHHNILVKNITVVGRGGAYVSAIVAGGETNSIVESATITNPRYYNDYWNVTNGDYTYSTQVIENGNPQGGFDVINLNDINFYETAGMDTWIGGDNDNTGYYWDYSGNEIILKDTATSPITFNLSGSGSESDPYIINSVSDWRQASTRPTACYKLGSDIDFTNNHYYMLGSRINHYTGIFNGNAKFVSNIIINAIPVNSIGMFGYTNEARIYAINVINPRISGQNYVGAIVGEDHDSSVREIALEGGNLVSASSWCSGIIGWQTGGIHNQYLIKNITVDSDGNVGAANYSGSDNTFVEYATVNNRRYYNDYWNIVNGSSNGYIEVRENGGVYTSVDAYYKDRELYYNNYLETRYSGDTNGTGYMFTAVPERDNKIYVTENKAFEANPTEDATDPHEGSGSSCSCTAWVLHGRTTYRTGSDRSCRGTQYGSMSTTGCYTYKLQGMGPASMSNTADGKWFCSAELLTRSCTRN